jgi:hypothetical protein
MKHLEKKKCQPFPSFLYSLNCILDCCPRLEQSFVDKKLGESIHHPRYYFLSLHLIFIQNLVVIILWIEVNFERMMVKCCGFSSPR